jgi:hypothetical protein
LDEFEIDPSFTHYFTTLPRSVQQYNLKDLEICRTSFTVVSDCLAPLIMAVEYPEISDDMSNGVFPQLLYLINVQITV